MDFENTKIPQFEVTTPLDEMLKNGTRFVMIGAAAGAVAAILYERSVRATTRKLNQTLWDGFVDEVKRVNQK